MTTTTPQGSLILTLSRSYADGESGGRGKLCVAALGLATVLAACGGTAAPSPSTPAPASAPAGKPAAQSATSAAPAASSPVPSGLTPINVAFAAQAAVYDPWFIAMDKGYDVEQGLKIQMTMAGGGVATPALMSNKLDYSTSAASAFSAILKGAPLKVVFTNADKPQYQLWSTTPAIKTLADLKGKSIAVQSRGDTFEIAVRIELLKNGIDPNTVSYTPLGTGSVLLAAFKGGSVGAVLIVATLAKLKPEVDDQCQKANKDGDHQRKENQRLAAPRPEPAPRFRAQHQIHSHPTQFSTYIDDSAVKVIGVVPIMGVIGLNA